MATKEIPFGFIKDGRIYLSAFGDLPDREIGEVRDEDEEASVQYFVDRFEQFSQKVDEIEKLIEESVNKGSFLMKLRHMKESVRSHDGLGDYVPLMEKLDRLDVLLTDVIQKNRVRNTDIKRALLLELEASLKEPDWKSATNLVLDIKSRWVKTGNATDEVNDGFESKFALMIDDFFQRKKEFYEERRKLSDLRVGKYEAIVKELKQARNISGDQIQELKSRWAEVGQVPAMKYKPLQREFNYALKQALNPRRQRFEIPSEEDQKKNLEKKNHLIEQLGDVSLSDVEVAIKNINEIKSSWRETGMVPKEHYREQQDKFNDLADRLLELCFLEKTAKNYDRNYEKKNSREQVRVKIRILRDLLTRDEKELQTFYENLQKVQGSKSSFNKMLDRKLIQQKRKVQVKKSLLKSLKQSLDQI